MDTTNIIAIIPARYASTRFPGKPLAMLAGKPVIQHVYEQASKALNNLCVATDDERIFNTVESFGGKAVMTSPNHKSGTDRIEEAVEKIGTNAEVIVNIQGDEPFIHPSQITALCQCFDNPQTQIATLGKPFESLAAAQNPNSPKIVTDNEGFALYFSRSLIPYLRDKEKLSKLAEMSAEDFRNSQTYIKHLGIYAYRRSVLKEITQLPQSSLELAESLEQLRWLQNGYKIKVALTDIETIGIDTPEDLKRAEESLRK